MHEHLPRLQPEHYRGLASVHWTLTLEKRAIGWLNELFHARWRELLVHTLLRYELICPAYCLMPDHAHVVWMGVGEHSDQRNAMKFFRRETSGLLRPHRWQRQPFDHVLREAERERGALADVCRYVLENPVRKSVVAEAAAWHFSGAVVPGYPTLDPRMAGFWDLFWKIYAAQIECSRIRENLAAPETAKI